MISLIELERRCQKPDHRRIGNWMARRISRPLALRVTRVVLPLGITANTVTIVAWLVAMSAAATFACGTTTAWVVGAALLQVWYLLDHVDGQLARYYWQESLDGVQLDYLMHHTVNLVVPFGIGWGIAVRVTEPTWLLVGMATGTSLLLLGLIHDARYKSFIKRLKRMRGELIVTGGGGGRPAPTPPLPRRPWRLAAHLARKACETHVVMNSLALLAAVVWLVSDKTLLGGRIYLATIALVSLAVLAVTLCRSLGNGAAEREFAAWFRPPPDHVLAFRGGWWIVEPAVRGTFPSSTTDVPE